EGCQLLPEENDKVIECIDKIERELDIERADDLQANENIHFIGEEMDNLYYAMIRELALHKDLNKDQFKVVFSPQHGTSYQGLKKILVEEGYQVIFVEEQCAPDPDFSHTKSPNPENEKAYELAIEYAKRQDADIIITTDPDGDRLGAMVKNDEGQYQLLNGNQIGVILLEYRIYQMKKKGIMPKKPYVVTTIVTSEMGQALCKAENVEMELVLTGFKYIGDLIHQYEKSEKTFLLGYEESYGYNLSDKVRDKDALQAAYLLLEAACYYKQKEGVTLLELLQRLYERYGYYHEQLFDFEMPGVNGIQKIAEIMDRVRQNPPEKLGNIPVKEIQDFEKGYKDIPPANVIKIRLSDKSFVALRPSGTEPKFKLYVSIVGQDKIETEQKLTKVYEDIKKYIDA
ncbi:MAG: phospho-sugar mutase, partial [Peptostreptococcales bacterium]